MIFRACPVQDSINTGVINYLDSNEILFIGSSSRLLDPIPPGGTMSFDMHVVFSTSGEFKMIAHAEQVREKRKAVVKKSKYEASEVFLEDIESIHWFKSGIRMIVLETDSL